MTKLFVVLVRWYDYTNIAGIFSNPKSAKEFSEIDKASQAEPKEHIYWTVECYLDENYQFIQIRNFHSQQEMEDFMATTKQKGWKTREDMLSCERPFKTEWYN